MRILFFIMILSINSMTWAFDYISFIDKNCKKSQGLIIKVDEEKAYYINERGQIQSILRKDVDAVLIYKINENNLPIISLSPDLKTLLKDIYLQDDSSKPRFTAWPIQFIEDVVIFFDTTGKIHILDIDKIQKIRPTSIQNGELRLKYRSDFFSVGDLPISCPQIDKSQKGNPPSRTLIDLIQVKEFFSSLEKGFNKLNSFEERTYFYARPIIFDTKTRMGVGKIPSNDHMMNDQMQWYFQWGNGEPYRYQSTTRMGMNVDFPESPTFGNSLVYYTELKSHLFHAVFAGNLLALSAGSEVFAPTIALSSSNGQANQEWILMNSFNYLAMIGMDYENWSFSFGTYFPDYMIKYGNTYREIIASDVTPIFRLRFMKKYFESSLIYSHIQRGANSNITDRQLVISPKTLSSFGVISNYDFNADFIRANISYDTHSLFKFGGGVISHLGHYSDHNTISTVMNFNFKQTLLFASISKEFGNYVSLTFYQMLYQHNEDMQLGDSNINNSFQNSTTGGTLEFIF